MNSINKTILMCVLFSAFVFAQYDMYGNWCKGNLQPKEKQEELLLRFIRQAPDYEAQGKLESLYIERFIINKNI